MHPTSHTPTHTEHPTPTPAPEPLPSMPRHDHDNQVLQAVAAEHDISLTDLAADTGISTSFLSRVFSGQYAAPPALIRAMWGRTSDHRVARVALGDGALDQLHAGPADQRLELLGLVTRSLAEVSEQLTQLATGRGSPLAARQSMTEASRCMRTLDSHLQTATHSGGLERSA